MSDTVDSLVLDLLDWIGPDPRPFVFGGALGGVEQAQRKVHAPATSAIASMMGV